MCNVLRNYGLIDTFKGKTMFVLTIFISLFGISSQTSYETSSKTYSYNKASHNSLQALAGHSDVYQKDDGSFEYNYRYGNPYSNVQVSFLSSASYPKKRNVYEQQVSTNSAPQYIKSPRPQQYIQSSGPQQYIQSSALQHYIKVTAPQQHVKSPAQAAHDEMLQLSSNVQHASVPVPNPFKKPDFPIPVYIPKSSSALHASQETQASFSYLNPVQKEDIESATQYCVGCHERGVGTFKVPAYPSDQTKGSNVKYENPNNAALFRDLYKYHPDTYGFAYPEKDVPLNVFGLPPQHRYQHPVGNVESSRPVIVETNAHLPGPVVDSGVLKGNGHINDEHKFHRLYDTHPDTHRLVNPEKNGPLNVFGLPPKHHYQSPHGTVNSFRPAEVSSNVYLPGPVVDTTLSRPNLASSFSGRVPVMGNVHASDRGSLKEENFQNLKVADSHLKLYNAIGNYAYNNPNGGTIHIQRKKENELNQKPVMLQERPRYISNHNYVNSGINTPFKSYVNADLYFDRQQHQRIITNEQQQITDNKRQQQQIIDNQRQQRRIIDNQRHQPQQQERQRIFDNQREQQQRISYIMNDHIPNLSQKPLLPKEYIPVEKYNEPQKVYAQYSQGPIRYSNHNAIPVSEMNMPRYGQYNPQMQQHIVPHNSYEPSPVNRYFQGSHNKVNSNGGYHQNAGQPFLQYREPQHVQQSNSQHSSFSYYKPQEQLHTIGKFPPQILPLHHQNHPGSFGQISEISHMNRNLQNIERRFMDNNYHQLHLQQQHLQKPDRDNSLNKIHQFKLPQQFQPDMNNLKTLFPSDIKVRTSYDVSNGYSRQFSHPETQMRIMTGEIKVPESLSVYKPTLDANIFAKPISGNRGINDILGFQKLNVESAGKHKFIYQRPALDHRKLRELSQGVQNILKDMLSPYNSNQKQYWEAYDEEAELVPAVIEKDKGNQPQMPDHRSEVQPFPDIYYPMKVNFRRDSYSVPTTSDSGIPESEYSESYFPSSRRGGYISSSNHYPERNLLGSFIPNLMKLDSGLRYSEEIAMINDYPKHSYDSGYSYNSPNRGFKVGLGPLLEREVLF